MIIARHSCCICKLTPGGCRSLYVAPSHLGTHQGVAHKPGAVALSARCDRDLSRRGQIHSVTACLSWELLHSRARLEPSLRFHKLNLCTTLICAGYNVGCFSSISSTRSMGWIVGTSNICLKSLLRKKGKLYLFWCFAYRKTEQY